METLKQRLKSNLEAKQASIYFFSQNKKNCQKQLLGLII